MKAFTALLDLTRPVFRAPSFAIFTDLLSGWVCAPGRRTVTAMIAVADPAGRRAHDAYHRLLRDGAWGMSGLWRVLAVHAVGAFAATGVVSLDLDDTLFHKTGRKVAGAGQRPPAPQERPHHHHRACHTDVAGTRWLAPRTVAARLRPRTKGERHTHPTRARRPGP